MRPSISPSGIREAKIAIIVDCPEDIEVARRTLFPDSESGGKQLNNLLRMTGINRAELYITSVIKERPFKGNINTYLSYSKKNNKFKITENYKQYEKLLYDELKSVKANVLVPMGNLGMYALTRQWYIHQRRGSMYEGVDAIDNRKVIGTINPRVALRKFEYNYSILVDLARIKNESDFPDVRITPNNIIVKPTFQESLKYLAICNKSPIVGFDIETKFGEVSCISFSYKEHEGISIPFIWNNFNHYTIEEETDIWIKIGELLENPDVYKITQNGTFDTTYLFDKYGCVCTETGDTMIQHAILYPELLKGLAFITSTQTDMPYYKDEGKFKVGESRALDEEFAAYSAKDSIVLMTAYPKLETFLKSQGNYETYDNQRKLIPILAYMNTRGMRMDVEGLKTAKHKSLLARDAAKALILKLTDGIVTNPGSDLQLRKYFYGVLGLPPIRAKGSVTVDGPAMKKISLLGHEEADAIIDFRTNELYGNQFYGVILSTDNRLRNSTNPVGTVNGRLSSSSDFNDEGMNVQNPPHKFKRYILADEGYVMYDLDLGQAENRIVAYIAPEPAMISAFENGIDVHKKTAGLLFNKPIDEIGEDDLNPCSFGNGKRSERYWGKQSNHSFNYDLGPMTFARKQGIHPKDSKRLINDYHAAYPGVRRYHAWVRDELNRNRQTLVNPYGRHRKFMGRPGDEMHKKAYNFIPQSLVADKINREGLIHVYYDQVRYKHLELLNQVHDSMVVQIPLSVPFIEHAIILAHIRDSLEKEISWMGRKFTIPLDAKIGLNLGKWNEDNPTGMVDVDISNLSIAEIKNNITQAYGKIKDVA